MATIYLKKDQIIYTSHGTYTVKDYYDLVKEDADLLNKLTLPGFNLKDRLFYDVKVDRIEYCSGIMDTISVIVGDNYSRSWEIVINKDQKFYDFTGERDPYSIVPGNQIVTDNGMIPVKKITENMNSVELYKFTLDAECIFVDKVLIKTIPETETKKTKKRKNDK